jgi:hypothetical protein
MKRAYDAKACGDLEAMRTELRFIAQSSLEDMKAAIAAPWKAPDEGARQK